ncbi:cathelicidin antimicrobial peptide isoform X2 [Ictidomys tridecemlineatus]
MGSKALVTLPILHDGMMDSNQIYPALEETLMNLDEDPDTPKPVSFTVKETVCPKTTQQTLEQCDFKEDGLVKRCVGTVTLDPARDSFDINCDGPQHFKKIARLGGLLQKGGEKIGEKLENIGRKIKDFFQGLVPRLRS